MAVGWVGLVHCSLRAERYEKIWMRVYERHFAGSAFYNLGGFNSILVGSMGHIVHELNLYVQPVTMSND